MKRHVKIYLESRGYWGEEYVVCEWCGGRACDVHHLRSRGMGGSKNRDVPSNLVALCRLCHNKAHGIREGV